MALKSNVLVFHQLLLSFRRVKDMKDLPKTEDLSHQGLLALQSIIRITPESSDYWSSRNKVGVLNKKRKL